MCTLYRVLYTSLYTLPSSTPHCTQTTYQALALLCSYDKPPHRTGRHQPIYLLDGAMKCEDQTLSLSPLRVSRVSMSQLTRYLELQTMSINYCFL